MHHIRITARADNFIGAQLSGISPDEAARLIAAAPALLDALQTAYAALAELSFADHKITAARVKARAAIATAIEET